MGMFDAVIDSSVTTATELINNANVLAGKLINAGNQAALVAEVRETSEDPQIVKFREFLEKINQKVIAEEGKIDQYIVETGLVSTEPVDVEVVSAEYNALKAQIKGFKDLLKTLPGVDETVLGRLPELKATPGSRGTGSGGNRATGPRPRITGLTIDGVDVFTTKDDKHVVNFTLGAQAISKLAGTKVEVKDLQEAAWAASGVGADLKALNGKPFEFAFNAGKEGEQKNYMVRVVPAAAE